MITKEEVEKVVKLTSTERLNYFIKRAADFEEVWVLFNKNDGYGLNVEDDGSKYFPVWPFKEFSDQWINDAFANFNSKKIDVYIFKDEIIPKLIQNKIEILVFPTETGKGFIIEGKDFNKLLDNELEKYE